MLFRSGAGVLFTSGGAFFLQCGEKRGEEMKNRRKLLAILLGAVLCISAVLPADPMSYVYGAETSGPNVNDNGTIIADIDSRYNESKQREEMISSLGEDDMEYQIWQEGEYGFGGLRWSIWGNMQVAYTEISINKKLLKAAYQRTNVPVEVETVLGNFCISSDLMRYLVKKGKGKDIKLVLEKGELSDKEKKIYGEGAYVCSAYFTSGGKKITDLGSESVEITLSIRDKVSGALQAGRLDSKGKFHSVKSRLGGQIGNFRCRFDTKRLGTFILTSSTRIEYAKRVTAVTSSQLKIKTVGKKNAIGISWKKPSGFKPTGYQIMASSKKSGAYKRIKTTKKLSCVDSGLKKGTKKYYKVRPYAKINGEKIYGKWSSIKAATAK